MTSCFMQLLATHLGVNPRAKVMEVSKARHVSLVQPQSGVRVPYDINILVAQAALPVNGDIYQQQAAISAMHGSGVRMDMLLAATPPRELPPLDRGAAAPFAGRPINAVAAAPFAGPPLNAVAAAAAAAGQQPRAVAAPAANLAAFLASFSPTVMATLLLQMQQQRQQRQAPPGAAPV
jgi:hypothetical protein